MGHHDDGARIVAQMMLEPGDAFGVEVVGRLVEQKNVGLRQEKPAERDAAALAARQGLRLRLARRTAQRVHRLLDLSVKIPQALAVDLVLEPRHLVRRLVGIVHGKLVVAVELRLLVGNALHGIAGDVLGVVEGGLLREIADAHALGRPGLAHELGLIPRHDTKERRFARPVHTDHADLGAGEKGERDVLQHLLAASIGLGQAVHDIDILGRGHRRSVSSSKCGRKGSVGF